LKKTAVDVEATVTTSTEGVAAKGITVVNENIGRIQISLSEAETAELKEGIQDLDLIIKVGASDLNIPPQLKALDVREAPF
jgi:hypothetical protein